MGKKEHTQTLHHELGASHDWVVRKKDNTALDNMVYLGLPWRPCSRVAFYGDWVGGGFRYVKNKRWTDGMVSMGLASMSDDAGAAKSFSGLRSVGLFRKGGRAGVFMLATSELKKQQQPESASERECIVSVLFHLFGIFFSHTVYCVALY